jgi:hypothetical protein
VVVEDRSKLDAEDEVMRAQKLLSGRSGAETGSRLFFFGAGVAEAGKDARREQEIEKKDFEDDERERRRRGESVWVWRAKSFSWRVKLRTAVKSSGSELNSHVPSAAFCASGHSRSSECVARRLIARNRRSLFRLTACLLHRP